MAKNALCIGINDYPGTGSDLSGCVNDAHDWAARLQDSGYTVSTLIDRQASREAMLGTIGDLIGSAQNGDTIVLTYSGHGTWLEDTDGDEPDARDEALCPWDITTAGPLLDDDIRKLFDARSSGVRLLLISDSCHSGSVTRGDESDLDANAPRASSLPLAGGLRRVGGDLLLAGCRDDQYSWDTSFAGRPNGAFTFYALKTLRQNEPETYDQWFAAIRQYLPSTRLPQEPQIFGTRSARQMRVFE